MEATDKWIPFEGRMVRPDVKRHVEQLRSERYVRINQGAQSGVDPEKKAEIALDQSHKEYLKEKRREERDEQFRQAEESLREARAVDLGIKSVSEDPKVQALREKLEAVRTDSAEALQKAKAALEDARQTAEALEEEAARLEADAAAGEGDEKKAEAAAEKARKAWRASDKAEAALVDAKRDAARSERVQEILQGQLEAAEAEAAQQFEAEARQLLSREIERARDLAGAASEAQDRLYRIYLELQRRGVSVPAAPHLHHLLSPEVYGRPTGYSRWLESIEVFLNENHEVEE